MFDEEIGLYYLRSRYYRPGWCRFVNADSLIKGNLYCYCKNSPINCDDQDGHLWEIALLSAVLLGSTMLMTSCTPYSEYGAAPNYKYIKGSNDYHAPNCYAAAMGVDYNLQPGQIGGRQPQHINDVEDVYLSVESDVLAMGYTIRRLDSYSSPIAQNERRIALRVGTAPYYYLDQFGEYQSAYDYHFMYQTSSGNWAEKHGIGGDSICHYAGETPDSLSWDLANIISYYDSDIVYFAIGE